MNWTWSGTPPSSGEAAALAVGRPLEEMPRPLKRIWSMSRPPVGNAKNSLCLPAGGVIGRLKSCWVSHAPVLGTLTVPRSCPVAGSSMRTWIGPPPPPEEAVTVSELMFLRSTGSQAM